MNSPVKYILTLPILWLVLQVTISYSQEYNSVYIGDMKVVSGSDVTTGEIFDSKSNYLHPYLSIREEYTDNLYNINIDEANNFLTVVSTGIRFGLPWATNIPLDISHYNEAIGGSRFYVPGSGSFGRFAFYLLGGLDYKNYSTNPDLNNTVWHFEGMIQYNLPAGMSFRVTNLLTRDRDRFDFGSFLADDFTVEENDVYVTSTPSRIRDYYSNQAAITVNFDMSEKFSALFNYTSFFLIYDDDTNDSWLDRVDNKYSLSLDYKYSLKTSLFVEYAEAFINYDTDNTNDSKNLFLFGGVKWKGSAKTSLMTKGGYQVKKFDNIDQGDAGTFTMAAILNYLITDKTKLSFNLYKSFEETDSFSNRGKDTIAGKFSYRQQFSPRINGYCEFSYEKNNYEEFSKLDNNLLQDEARNDTRFMVKPAVQYQFSDWLMTELAYSFENRDSNKNIYDFTTQTVFLSLNASF